MRRWLIVIAALAALASGRLVRSAALDSRASWPRTVNIPFAPSVDAAPYASLGYRELGADLLWIRMLGYLGGDTDTSDGVLSLVEGTLALDPYFRPAYDIGAQAVERADYGVNNDSHLAAIKILNRGRKYFPDRWQYPYLAGQTYLVELETDKPEQRRDWTEKGVALLEEAIRMPDAPASAAADAAHFQETLGRHEVAVNNLKEMLLITTDERSKKALLDQLAKLEHSDASDLAIAMLDERNSFLDDWHAHRPALPATLYLLLGPRRDPYLPPSAFAVDRDLIGAHPPEPLEPLFGPEVLP